MMARSGNMQMAPIAPVNVIRGRDSRGVRPLSVAEFTDTLVGLVERGGV